MEHVVCNVCGCDRYTIRFRAGRAQVNQVVTCDACGLMYANPRSQVDHQIIERWPPDAIFQDPRRIEKEHLQVRDYGELRQFINALRPAKGTLLEVGAGLGCLLNRFQRDGWQVRGVEPNKGCCGYARSEFGIDLVPATLEQARLAASSVDVALMLHVIEHLPDPAATLAELHRILKPGGILVIETPRYDSLMFALLGSHERSVSHGGHLYFFTTTTLRRLTERAGYEPVKLDLVGRTLTLDRLLWNIGLASKSRTLGRVLDRLSVGLRLNKLVLHLNLRDMQRLIVRATSPTTHAADARPDTAGATREPLATAKPPRPDVERPASA